MFESLNPATGQPIATFPVHQRADADMAVSRAREAARWWGALGWRERRSRLLDWKSHLVRHMDGLAQLVHEETGKPADDGHLADAVTRGGRALPGSAKDAVDAPYVRPVILTDVPEDSAAVTEETFGPTITVRRVASLEEGVRLANASSYGLGSSVFARNRRRAWAAARELRSGMTAINSVIAFAMVPALPFGGVGESGFGRIHGADGLREFARAKAITSQWMKPPANLTSFGRTDADLKRTLGLITLLHGRRGRRGRS